MADDAAAVVEDAAVEADVAADADVAEVAAEADVAAETGMADLLTTDGFDAGKVLEMINGSDMSEVQKTVLAGAVNSVKDNPALLEATLTRIKEAMGQ